MEPIYVTGHRNPDTDSIVAAISYASLKNALGERNVTAARIGEVSDETQLVLNKFGFAAPERIRNLRTQVRDLSYDTPPILSAAVTVHHAWEEIINAASHIEALPVADEDGKLFGMLTSADIAAFDLRFVHDAHVTGIPLFNLLSCLDGQLRTENSTVDEISGELMIALTRTDDVIHIPEGAIVVSGNRPDVFRAAVRAKASCLVVCEVELDKSLLKEAKDMLVISTPHDAYRAARLIIQSVPVSRVCRTEELVSFHLNDYLDDVKEATLKTRYRSYPVLDENDRVVGALSRYHLLRPNRKRVILVDHNEAGQSISGLDQAEIVEIIDHHRLADVETLSPVYVRNEPVGSTCTIITSIYQERGIMPSPKLAGLLCAAIISDTIMFKSPTCTEKDRLMAERMAKLAGLSIADLGREIFAASVLGAHDLKELVFTDFKQFQIANHILGIGQITCLDSAEMVKHKAEFIKIMEEERAAKNYDMLLLMLTDVLREGTELLAVGDIDTVEHAFNADVRDNAVFLPGVISRKKQIVPALSLLWG